MKETRGTAVLGSVKSINQFDEALVMERRQSRILPILVIAALVASMAATAILAFYGIYFFFFFIPLAFGLPWSVKKLWRDKARKQWNVEDMR